MSKPLATRHQPTWRIEVQEELMASIASSGKTITVNDTMVEHRYINQVLTVLTGTLKGERYNVTHNTTGVITLEETVGTQIVAGDRVSVTTWGQPPGSSPDAEGNINDLFGQCLNASLPMPTREFFAGRYHGSSRMPSVEEFIPMTNDYAASPKLILKSAAFLALAMGIIEETTTDYDAADPNLTMSVRTTYPGEKIIDFAAAVSGYTVGDLVRLTSGTGGLSEVGKIAVVQAGAAIAANANSMQKVIDVGAGNIAKYRPGQTIHISDSGTPAGENKIIDTINVAAHTITVTVNLVASYTTAQTAVCYPYSITLTHPCKNYHHTDAKCNEIKATVPGIPDTVITKTLTLDHWIPTFTFESGIRRETRWTGQDIVQQFMGLVAGKFGFRSSPGNEPLSIEMDLKGLHWRYQTLAAADLNDVSAKAEVGFDAGPYLPSLCTTTINGVVYNEDADFSCDISRNVQTERFHHSGDIPYNLKGDPICHYFGAVDFSAELNIPLKNRNFITLLRSAGEFDVTRVYTRAGTGDQLTITLEDCSIKGPLMPEIPEDGMIMQKLDLNVEMVSIEVKDSIPYYVM